MRYMYDWRDSIILELERQCTATQSQVHDQNVKGKTQTDQI